MYHLLTGLYAHLTRKTAFGILIVGLDAAGKTLLLDKIKELYTARPAPDPGKVQPTVGQNIAKIPIQSAILTFWDLGGAAGLRGLWEKYYDEAHVVVFVVDSSDRSRLREAWEAFEALKIHPSLRHIPILLLLSKSDLSTSSSSASEHITPSDLTAGFAAFSAEAAAAAGAHDSTGAGGGLSGRLEALGMLGQEGKEGAEHRGGVLECSAVTGHGVREAVDWLFIRCQNSGRPAKVVE